MNQNNSGTILIIALWVLSILTVIALGFGYRMSVEVKTSGLHTGKLISHYLAKSAVLKMIRELENKNRVYDALNESWANDSFAFKDYHISQELGTYTVSCERRVVKDRQDSTETFYGAMDEESKISLSAPSEETVKKLLRACGESPDLSDAILDWIDPDSNERFHGAEDSYYQHLEHPYHCRNGAPKMLNELLLIKGIDKKIFDKIKDRITIYGSGKININTADRATLELIGATSRLIENIMTFRNGPDGIAGTRDDGIFLNAGAIEEDIQRVIPIGGGELALLTSLKPLLTVKSNYFKISAVGFSPNNVQTRITAVVFRPDTGRAQIVSWEES